MPRPLTQFASTGASDVAETDESDTRSNRVKVRLAKHPIGNPHDTATIYEAAPGHRKLTLDVGGTANVYTGT